MKTQRLCERREKYPAGWILDDLPKIVSAPIALPPSRRFAPEIALISASLFLPLYSDLFLIITVMKELLIHGILPCAINAIHR